MPPNALLQDGSERNNASTSTTGGPNADEHTSLLPKSLAQSLPPKHYKDIDGVRFWWLLACILAATMIATFDSTFMASSHPVITSYFESSNAASWLTTVFYLTSTVAQPLYGRISDVTGRRPVYTFSILFFGLATAWCGFASNIQSFIIARALCGVAAGGMNAMSMVLMSDAVKLEFRGIYQSYLNIAYGLGTGSGAALGGLLCDKLGWRAAFFVQCPFIFVLALVAFFATPKNFGPALAKSEGKTILQALESFDFAGVAALIITISGLILGINLGGNIYSWTHPLVLTALVVFVLSIPFLIYVERRAHRPMLPLELLAGTPSARLNWANVMSMLLSAAELFNVPLFLQAVGQATPTTSGLVLISPLVLMSAISICVGFYMASTKRIKVPLVGGALFYLVGTAALSGLHKGMPTWTILLTIPWCLGGQGFMGPGSTVATLSLNPPSEQAVVVTTLAVARNIGSILGVAVSSWILQNALKIFLEQKVTGPDDVKERIIYEVRKSVKAIAKLDGAHKTQVVDAYMLSLRVTFASLCAFAVVLVVLIMITRVPDLKGDNSTSDEDRGHATTEDSN